MHDCTDNRETHQSLVRKVRAQQTSQQPTNHDGDQAVLQDAAHGNAAHAEVFQDQMTLGIVARSFGEHRMGVHGFEGSNGVERVAELAAVTDFRETFGLQSRVMHASTAFVEFRATRVIVCEVDTLAIRLVDGATAIVRHVVVLGLLVTQRKKKLPTGFSEFSK